MLKPRVIGLVLVREGVAVQSIGFRRYLPIGRPQIAIRYLDRWGIDEIVVLHIDATTSRALPRPDEVASYAKQCQVPLAVGGGVSSVEEVRGIIRAGADKVVINSALVTSPDAIPSSVDSFGAQCVVASVDARVGADGTSKTFTHGGTKPSGFSAANLAASAERLGAGEILITSIDRDGSRRGYDARLIGEAVEAVRVPVIAAGGAGHPRDLQAGIACGASAVAVGNLLHFTEHSVITIKQQLLQSAVMIRLDTYATYVGYTFDGQGRIRKREDPDLEELRFRYLPEEKI